MDLRERGGDLISRALIGRELVDPRRGVYTIKDIRYGGSKGVFAVAQYDTSDKPALIPINDVARHRLYSKPSAKEKKSHI